MHHPHTFPDPSPLSQQGPAKIIALCNQKGGVGKTTTSINLGAVLAECGRRTLLIDFDPQGALSSGLGIRAHDVTTIYDLMIDRKIPITEAIQRTNIPGLDAVPANIDLSAAEVNLIGEVAREHILSMVLKPIVQEYSVILIDCQPSLGVLAVNALTASHGVIVPLECEYFALRGVALLLETIEKVRERLNPALRLEGILPTMFDARTLHAREVLERVNEGFTNQVLQTIIKRTVKLPDASVAGEPLITFDPSHPVTQAYRQLARELISRGTIA